MSALLAALLSWPRIRLRTMSALGKSVALVTSISGPMDQPCPSCEGGCGGGRVTVDREQVRRDAETKRGRNRMSDLSSYAKWKSVASTSANAALDIYTDREADVERELALHLARALRELDKRDGSVDEALDELVADGLFEARDAAREQAGT